MGLRKKTLITIGMTLILMVLIIYSITNTILLGGYANLERENIILSMDQAMKVIDDELGQLQTIVGDWAPWNDTYFFVQNKNQKYIDDNLMDLTLVNLHINFLLFINTAGEIVHCTYLDLESGRGEACPESIKKYLSFEGSFILRNESKNETLSGLAILPENPILIASAPILTSQFKGPVMGTLIAGRYLNAPEIKRLASLINLPVTFERLDSPSLSDSSKKAKQSLFMENKVAIIPLDENTIAAYSLVTDLTGSPILMLGIDKERTIYSQGKTDMRYLVYSLLIIGIVFIIATLISLEVTVLSRLVRLNSDVKKIARTGDLFAKTTMTGKDELFDLSTQINLMIESVRVSTERDRAILESIEDAYFELDLSGNLTFYNDAMSRIFGYEGQNLGKMNYRKLLDESAAEEASNTFQHLYNTGIPIRSMETEFKLKSGQKIYLESSAALIKDNNGKVIGFRGISRDVTEQKESSKKLLYMVYHDSLTGLLNRKAFHENLEKELSYADRYKQQRVVMYVDLDKFKKVNDTFGHDAGDHLLKGFAHRVKKILRDTDLVYRLGGDEFAIILTNPEETTPNTIAQRIIDVMAQPFYLKSQTIDFVTTSIGISFYPLDATDAETLLQCADKAMYEAKKMRNQYVIYQGNSS
ncbi:sensor domain-containing diguanylate cyclase [Desulfobacter curvatus]|uniref:sensor domain-containing diguanylate cyclase n=1 Tax=Desulfobacter curvatus TaxID=2290 RepID=UPI0003708329|nr:diguanylate cyclase [Desulfobacter curvatus]